VSDRPDPETFEPRLKTRMSGGLIAGVLVGAVIGLVVGLIAFSGRPEAIVAAAIPRAITGVG
jgi:predicted lipid-binding transport protein (Tim44 family)